MKQNNIYSKIIFTLLRFKSERPGQKESKRTQNVPRLFCCKERQQKASNHLHVLNHRLDHLPTMHETEFSGYYDSARLSKPLGRRMRSSRTSLGPLGNVQRTDTHLHQKDGVKGVVHTLREWHRLPSNPIIMYSTGRWEGWGGQLVLWWKVPVRLTVSSRIETFYPARKLLQQKGK